MFWFSIAACGWYTGRAAERAERVDGMAFRSFLIGAVLAAGPALAQEAKIAFGDLTQDITLPVEVSAESFSVNNADGTAVFSGGVTVTQGEMMLQAAEVRVQYSPDQSRIDRLLASGGVTITNLGDSAQADQADYAIDTGVIVLTGNVRLAQGPSTMTGGTLTINLQDGSGVMAGGVTTTFVPGGN
jgi:lipopolysaccharide export system protein LptA